MKLLNDNMQITLDPATNDTRVAPYPFGMDPVSINKIMPNKIKHDNLL